MAPIPPPTVETLTGRLGPRTGCRGNLGSMCSSPQRGKPNSTTLAMTTATTFGDTAQQRSARSPMAIDQATKILIVLQAGTESHEGVARALHAVLYAKELDEAGATVRLVFDGAGTGWLARWRTAEGAASRAGSIFHDLRTRGLSYEVCDYCSGAFDVKSDLIEAGEALAGAYMDHPSLATHVAEGFAVWIL
jgi:hypothetical protein